ncbi:hypothetical protein C7S15_1631 [Burkholderia cepacia]|nr:hypothetical protein [Burkholderia cepacia]MDW9227064.1 hypothetical protein [Burkholderia cepacia]
MSDTQTPQPGQTPAIPEVDPSLERRFPLRRDIAPQQPAQDSANTPAA